jgi:hypothetical protein
MQSNLKIHLEYSGHCHFDARLDMQIFGDAPHNHSQVARRRVA